MGRPPRADRASVGDITFSVRLPNHKLAAIDAAVARAGAAAGRTITRNDFVLAATLRAVEEQGVAIHDTRTLLLPFPSTPLPSPVETTPAAPPPPIAVPTPEAAPTPEASEPEPSAPTESAPANRPKRKPRPIPGIENVDVVVLPPRKRRSPA